MRKRIGDFFLEKGVITQSQLSEILKYSQETGLRFGDAALKMELITPTHMLEIFGAGGVGNGVDFFYLEPEFFPKITKSVLTPLEMISWGALLLGLKTERRIFKVFKVLNIGLLDPKNKQEVISQILNKAQHSLKEENIRRSRVYLISPDHFIEILDKNYHFSVESMLQLNPGELDWVVQMVLEQRESARVVGIVQAEAPDTTVKP